MIIEKKNFINALLSDKKTRESLHKHSTTFGIYHYSCFIFSDMYFFLFGHVFSYMYDSSDRVLNYIIFFLVKIKFIIKAKVWVFKLIELDRVCHVCCNF